MVAGVKGVGVLSGVGSALISQTSSQIHHLTNEDKGVVRLGLQQRRCQVLQYNAQIFLRPNEEVSVSVHPVLLRKLKLKWKAMIRGGKGVERGEWKSKQMERTD